MRFGCFLVTLAVLASLVLEPPRAKAFAVTSSAVTALASGFLSACGLTPVVSGMGSSSEVNESVARLIQDFLDEEHPGLKDAVDWIGDAILTVNGGRVIIPGEMAKRLSAFATWVAGKYGTKPGVNQVYNGQSFFLADGTKINVAIYDRVDNRYIFDVPADITSFSFNTWYELRNGNKFNMSFSNDRFSCLYVKNVISGSSPSYSISGLSLNAFFIAVNGSRDVLPFYLTSSGYKEAKYFFVDDLFIFSNTSFFFDVSDTMQEVLDRLTALEEGQSIALDVGATQSMEIQDILQGILDAILAGDLTASAEIVDTADVPVEPEEPDPPVVPVVPSGLDKLGAALTSRFPFSIPWDVYKGVTLLAAPPKAPYFEVDFMAPIADRVGGWKGSTKIVLDFSEYEIIGQVCRWTSTIGFCLMLATGTKRLIWTA